MIVVPFKRVLYPPDADKGLFSGEDVLAVKIAIARAGLWPWKEFDETYNNLFAHGKRRPTKMINQGVAGFQRRNDLKVNGVYTEATHKKLVNTRVPPGKPHSGEYVFDKRARILYNGFEDVSPEEEMVAEIYKWWDYLISREGSVHYSQIRPIDPLRKREKPPNLPSYLDCSGTVIYTAWCAGAKSPDPVCHYTSYGYTGTLIQGGFRISHYDVSRYCKDHLVLAFYGPSRWNTKHVVSLKSPSKVYSNGSEAAPNIYSTAYYRGDLIEYRAYEVL